MIVKFAAADILEARVHQKGTARIGHKHTFDYDPRPGYLYVRSRAISSRTNDNYDNFPAPEIKKGYLSFVGKPVFVNHNNDDHRRARGVIIDAALHEDQNPDGSADTWVEVLMEISASKFPKLTQAILAGEIERTSMGVDVAFSVCSVCNHKATTPLEYCKHIPKMKGMKVRRTAASGVQEEVLVYEKCYGLAFFENSLLVEDPADPTAYFLDVDDRGLAMAASRKQGAGDWEGRREDGATVTIKEDKVYGGYRAWHSNPANPRDLSWTSGQDLDELIASQEAQGYVKTAASAGGRPCSICGKPATRYVMGPYAGDWGAYYCNDHPDPPDRGSIIENLTAAAAELDAEIREMVKTAARGVKLEFVHPRTQRYYDRTTDRPYTWVSFRGSQIAWHETEQAARRRSSEVYKLPAPKAPPPEPSASAWGRQPFDENLDKPVFQNHTYVIEATRETLKQKAIDHTKRIWAMHPTPGLEMPQKPGVDAIIIDRATELHDGVWEVEVEVLLYPTGSSKLGFGEQKAPVEVDTLREEFCPVCGEADSFDGDTCRVCQYIKPPDEFLDPDLDKAKQIDLHQDQAEVDDKQNELGELEDDIGIDEMPGQEEKPQLFDEEGNPVDQDGNPVELDENGHPIEDEVELDENGEPVSANPFGADQEAQPVGEEEPPDEEEDVGEDEDEEEDEDDEDGKGKGKSPPWLKGKDKSKKKSRLDREVTGGRPTMGPAMRHLISQQRRIARLEKRNRALEAGLVALSRLAGVEGHIAKVVKRAEDENPGNPAGWASDDTPAPEAPAFSTDETLGDVNNDAPGGGSATDEVESIGATSETDVAPDAQTSVTDTGVVLDEPLDLNEQDVTAPVAGAETLGEGERGNAGTNRTETEVRVGQPSNDVPFAETGWTSAARSFASLRLARLRLRAGIARGEQQDADLALGTAIASSPMSDAEIKAETETLDKVVAANPAARQQVKGNRVPRVASGQRTQPSLGSVPEPKLASSPQEDEFLLMDFGS